MIEVSLRTKLYIMNKSAADREPALPRYLSSEEIQDPFLVLEGFFDFDHIDGIREKLWELLKVAVTGGYGRSLNLKEREDLLAFWEWLEKLVEVCNLLREHGRQKPWNPKLEDPLVHYN